jgi:hypothetical protein
VGGPSSPQCELPLPPTFGSSGPLHLLVRRCQALPSRKLHRERTRERHQDDAGFQESARGLSHSWLRAATRAVAHPERLRVGQRSPRIRNVVAQVRERRRGGRAGAGRRALEVSKQLRVPSERSQFLGLFGDFSEISGGSRGDPSEIGCLRRRTGHCTHPLILPVPVLTVAGRNSDLVDLATPRGRPRRS